VIPRDVSGRMLESVKPPENRWMAQKQSSRRIPPEPPAPPARPSLADQPSRFMQLEREVEREYRPRMLAALKRKVDAVAVEVGSNRPDCPQCGRPMGHHDTRPATWLAHWGCLQVAAPRYRCSPYKCERRPLLEVLGVESGRICGSLARLLALLATVAPYELTARLSRPTTEGASLREVQSCGPAYKGHRVQSQRHNRTRGFARRWHFGSAKQRAAQFNLCAPG
jgi:hypothetical protein